MSNEFTCLRCNSKFTDKKHNNRKFCSRKCSKTAESNPQWKGENIGYGGVHSWVYNNLEKPTVCDNCKNEKPLDAANISGQYKREASDWEWLCRSCHMEKDGRMDALKLLSENKKLSEVQCVICNVSFHPQTSTAKYCSRKCYYIYRRSITYEPFGARAKQNTLDNFTFPTDL